MRFVFNITQVNKEALIKYPYAALDGDLIVLIEDSVFFDDGISLLDFALSIQSWLAKVRIGFLADFDYSSDEYTENPVLHLTKLDSHHYTIYSAWATNYPETILGLGEITHCFHNFLSELNATIQQEYGVGFSDMRLFAN
ncbi:hypothetical protein GCM10023172_14800 [Hymenobacter ginsengisoli]|uniref:DUF7878 domain-containing protein n=1 Tax=Hymenobacter ginsengisoli TaxID=1051626 RepID=A0ABP8Q6B1_9BACT|nr:MULTISPECIES: hypothetical protein [unclassified Hymenobacter]MBO2030970.1 hypothetical protein [Hymenobacter sp. BT559]